MKRITTVLLIVIVSLGCIFATSNEEPVKQRQGFLNYDIPYYYFNTDKNSGFSSSKTFSVSASYASPKTGFGWMFEAGTSVGLSGNWVSSILNGYARYRVKVSKNFFEEFGVGLAGSTTTHYGSSKEYSYSAWISLYAASLVQLSETSCLRIAGKVSISNGGVSITPQIGFGITR